LLLFLHQKDQALIPILNLKLLNIVSALDFYIKTKKNFQQYQMQNGAIKVMKITAIREQKRELI
jgi:hypothetical protein